MVRVRVWMKNRLWQKRLAMPYERYLLGKTRVLVRSWKNEYEDYCRVCKGQWREAFFWDGLGKLGRLIQLFYCARLFSRPQERKLYLDLHPNNSVNDEDLRHLVSVARLDLQAYDLETVIPVLDQVLNSAYFRYEKPSRCSQTVRCIRKLWHKSSERLVSRALASLLKDVLREYESKGGIHGWWSIERDYVNPFPQRVDTCVDDEHTLSLLVRAINSCSLTASLLTSRPPKSLSPHNHALMTCMQHAYLWMVNTQLPIYRHLPLLSYSALRSGPGDDLLAAGQNIFAQERVPSHEGIFTRRPLIWFKLYGLRSGRPESHNYESYESYRLLEFDR